MDLVKNRSRPTTAYSKQPFLGYLKGGSKEFNPYAAGRKVYGGGRAAPNVGPTSDKIGYRDREATNMQKRRVEALRRRLNQIRGS
jgi:hypothetical protein